MNDFTKEELMNMSDAILYSELMVSRGEALIPIRDKIKSMIDSYCEHENTTPNHDYEVEQCKKCRRLFV